MTPLRNTPRFALGLAVCALGASLFAIAFRGALSRALRLFAGARDVVEAVELFPIYARILLPALGGVCAGALGGLASKISQTSGVGDVMEAVVLGRTNLSLRATLIKSLASWCAIAAGGSVGREGPMIQCGGSFGQFVARGLNLQETPTRVLIACGTAAGFAAAYNTPLSAVLFVVEVVTGVIVLEAILPVLIATTISTLLTRASVGDGPIYGQRVFVMLAPLELIAFAGLAVATALIAVSFMQLLSLAEQLFKHIPSLPLRASCGGLLTGLCLAVLPAVAGNGYEPLNILLNGEFTPEHVSHLLVGKMIATICTVAAGNPGGVFTPTLLIGGSTGFLYGSLVAQLAHIGDPGSYALVGMAAATAACTHAPLMAAVLVFELSGDYAIVLPLMLSTALATLVAQRLRRESIYAAELKRRGIAWELTLEGRRVTTQSTRKR